MVRWLPTVKPATTPHALSHNSKGPMEAQQFPLAINGWQIDCKPVRSPPNGPGFFFIFSTLPLSTRTFSDLLQHTNSYAHENTPTCKLQAIMKKTERLATSIGTSLKRCNVSSPANWTCPYRKCMAWLLYIRSLSWSPREKHPISVCMGTVCPCTWFRKTTGRI